MIAAKTASEANKKDEVIMQGSSYLWSVALRKSRPLVPGTTPSRVKNELELCRWLFSRGCTVKGFVAITVGRQLLYSARRQCDMFHLCRVRILQMGDVYMVFEYLEYDLWALANSTEINLTPAHIRTYMKQMLDAIAYMHTNKVGFRADRSVMCHSPARKVVDCERLLSS